MPHKAEGSAGQTRNRDSQRSSSMSSRRSTQNRPENGTPPAVSITLSDGKAGGVYTPGHSQALKAIGFWRSRIAGSRPQTHCVQINFTSNRAAAEAVERRTGMTNSTKRDTARILACDDVRCRCGQLVARWAEQGIEIKVQAVPTSRHGAFNAIGGGRRRCLRTNYFRATSG